MEDMFNKIANMCESLSKVSNDDLRKNGIESIIICAWSTDFDNVTVQKGRYEYILAQIGRSLLRISKKMNRPLKEVLEGIYQCETEIERIEKEGENKWNGAL